MKKTLILTAVGAILATPATAVQKCVALNSNTICSSDTTQYAGKAEWAATCNTNGASVSVKGIASCASLRAGVQIGSVYSSGLLPAPSNSSTTNDGIFCYCKTISPAISPWVWLSSHSTPAECNYLCASRCAEAISSNEPLHETFMTNIFSNMSD